ncbi:MAG: hypothetical protein OXK82_02735 [Deltaproteobacteria bacterium]|nr:hypothetical protein [Deltaproteobacteria bacterium]
MMIGKKNLLLATVAALALAVAGCVHDNDDDSPATDMPDTEQPMDGDGEMPDSNGDGMMPSDPPSPEALANVIDWVANDGRRDEDGNYVSGWWFRAQGVVTQTYRGGTHVDGIIVSHDENGQLQHNVRVVPNDPLQQSGPWARPGRYIDTYETSEERFGATTSASQISDHRLEAEGWQVTELTADYDNGGTLTVLVAADVQPSDGSTDPSETATEIDYNIELPGAPALPDNQDYIVAWIPDGESVDGSLDGIAGTFACDNALGCAFIDDQAPGDYFALYSGVTFTPDGGTAQPVVPAVTDIVPNADYLAFGHWLYVPEDVTDSANYEFGVYASGGDPFQPANIAGLTGTATYEGGAVGMYYVNGLSSNPDVGSFTADVQLTADFGDSSATGFINGEVSNFVYEDDVASSLPATVTLASRTYDYLPTDFGVPQGSTNIFDMLHRGIWFYPGGHIGGVTEASVAGADWYGSWHGAFYGNGTSPTDHPTSVAGAFGSYGGDVWGDQGESNNGLTGSFGAHRQ